MNTRMRLHFCRIATALCVLAVAGCAQQGTSTTSTSTTSTSTTSTSTTSEPEVTDIRYEVGPCHGTCPVYSVGLDQTGTTRFTGKQFTAVDGERTRVNAAERFMTVKRRLSAWQPPMGAVVETAKTPNCGPRATDMSHYTVTWTGRDGETAVLEHDGGCRSADARALTQTLEELNGILGVESWVRR